MNLYLIPAKWEDESDNYFSDFGAALNEVKEKFYLPSVVNGERPLYEVISESGVLKPGNPVDLARHIQKIPLSFDLVEEKQKELEGSFPAAKESYQKFYESMAGATGIFPPEPTYKTAVAEPLQRWVYENSYKWM